MELTWIQIVSTGGHRWCLDVASSCRRDVGLGWCRARSRIYSRFRRVQHEATSSSVGHRVECRFRSARWPVSAAIIRTAGRIGSSACGETCDRCNSGPSKLWTKECNPPRRLNIRLIQRRWCNQQFASCYCCCCCCWQLWRKRRRWGKRDWGRRWRRVSSSAGQRAASSCGGRSWRGNIPSL